jgi:hypothetical protein
MKGQEVQKESTEGRGQSSGEIPLIVIAYSVTML